MGKLPTTQDFFGAVPIEPEKSKELGNIEAGIMLVHNCTETSWFQISCAGATRICFPSGRLDFINPARTVKSTPGRGQVLLYYGPDPKRFEEVFGTIGLVATLTATQEG